MGHKSINHTSRGLSRKHKETHRKIYDALIELSRMSFKSHEKDFGLSELVGQSGVPRDTFKYHFKNINSMFKYADKTTRVFAKKHTDTYLRAPDAMSLDIFFLRLLKDIRNEDHCMFFILANTRSSYYVWFEMLKIIKPAVTLEWKNYDQVSIDRCYRWFEFEFVALMAQWIEDNSFRGDACLTYADKATKLSRTVQDRFRLLDVW